MKAKLLLTGASGFIGSQIYNALKNDFEVTAIASSPKHKEYTALNLLNEEACRDFFKDKKFDLIIHAAAIAHGKNSFNTMSVADANILMTENVFNFLDIKDSSVIYLSSVSVYSFKNNKEIISVHDQPIPVTEYGISKLACEKRIKNKAPKSLHILRLAPVYSRNNLIDLGKRVFLPIFKVPFVTTQERVYSLCSIDQVVSVVVNTSKLDGDSLVIVKDDKDYTQNDLLSFFDLEKPKIAINRNFIKPLLWILSLIPVSKAHIIRDMFNKLFYSVRYSN
ncbi:NAD-dependent epimerase/dehydratase family protein [Chryseobacterium kwangjuense]|uniref:dTDP-4-dehydrorhamnose reductase n=1 Tax=Chryseobacterium kwangjuense TaxID=267125 RepID=A0ABW9JZ89_9FLAO